MNGKQYKIASNFFKQKKEEGRVEFKLDKVLKGLGNEEMKAYLVRINGIEYWIPKSQSEILGDTIYVKEWFAKRMDKRGAVFSDDGKKRYVLWRDWNEKGKVALCIGLNPSTANGDKDDPTITRLSRILSNLGYGGLRMVNLFTVISSDPSILKTEQSSIDADLGIIFGYSLTCQEIFFCWGAFPGTQERAQRLIDFYPNAKCFGKNKDGTPWHPLATFYAKLKTDEVKMFDFKDHQPKDNFTKARKKSPKKAGLETKTQKDHHYDGSQMELITQ